MCVLALYGLGGCDLRETHVFPQNKVHISANLPAVHYQYRTFSHFQHCSFISPSLFHSPYLAHDSHSYFLIFVPTFIIFLPLHSPSAFAHIFIPIPSLDADAHSYHFTPCLPFSLTPCRPSHSTPSHYIHNNGQT